MPKKQRKLEEEDAGDNQQLCAVYCTADIPVETINRFLRESVDKTDLAGREKALSEPCLIEDSKTTFFDHPTATSIPVEKCPSAYRNVAVEGLARRLNGEFSTLRNTKPEFRDSEVHINNVHYMEGGFVVLDERTLEDGSSLCVEIGLDGIMLLRTSFELALEVVQAAEMGYSWDEGYYSYWVDTGKVVDEDVLREHYWPNTKSETGE